jgi:hypothetical protein
MRRSARPTTLCSSFANPVHSGRHRDKRRRAGLSQGGSSADLIAAFAQSRDVFVLAEQCARYSYDDQQRSERVPAAPLVDSGSSRERRIWKTKSSSEPSDSAKRPPRRATASRAMRQKLFPLDLTGAPRSCGAQTFAREIPSFITPIDCSPRDGERQDARFQTASLAGRLSCRPSCSDRDAATPARAGRPRRRRFRGERRRPD